MTRRTAISLCAGALGVALAAAAWLLIAPRQIGGPASYVLVDGSSMAPALERGDLSVLRARSEYQVGDVVAYRSRTLDRLVLHRIVGLDGDRYVLKGDANDFVDPDKPTEADLAGVLWVTVPYAGAALSWLREPHHAALLVGLVSLAVLLGGVGGGVGLRRRATRRHQAPDGGRPPPRAGGRATQAALACSVAMAGAAILLGIVAFARPPQRAVTVADFYSQSGSFSYSAPTPTSRVYGGGKLRTGQPVFFRLVDELSVAFAYRVESRAPQRLTGTARFEAVLGDGTGWTHTMLLQPAKAFAGDAVTLRGVLDLPKVRARIDRFERATGVEPVSYTLTLLPRIDVRGTVGIEEIAERFAPRLVFRLDDLRMTLDDEGDADAALAPAEAGTGLRLEANTIAAPGLSLRVETARLVAVVGGGAALVAILAIAILSLARRGDEPSRISARYQPLLVPVAGLPSRPPESVIDVATIEDLARLAGRYGRMILHEEADGLHSYLVEDGGAVYRYRAREPEPSPAEDPMPAAAGIEAGLATTPDLQRA